jgi:survival-of-motor-neuron-related-splicing factor 30
VDGPSEGGAFAVVFEGYDSKEVVAREAIHLRVPEDDVGYQGMAGQAGRPVVTLGMLLEPACHPGQNHLAGCWEVELGRRHRSLCLRNAGVAPPKRRRVDDAAELQEMPKWLEVKATDDDKTKQKKRKLAKAFKSKARFAKLDLQQKQKADSWKTFLAGKSKKK